MGKALVIKMMNIGGWRAGRLSAFSFKSIALQSLKHFNGPCSLQNRIVAGKNDNSDIGNLVFSGISTCFNFLFLS